MIALSRRDFLASAVVASAAAAGRAEAVAPPLLLHDAGLEAGRRFAMRADGLGTRAIALAGDRVRQMRALLAPAPVALFAVTRRSDELLIGEIAAEAGYRRVALVRHGLDGRMTARCAIDGEKVGVLARASRAAWPEAFAELALDRVGQCANAGGIKVEPALSWVMVRG